MARENQGLQIALIILVVLAFVLMVTTFFGLKWYQEEFDRAEEAVAAKGEAADALGSAEGEIIRLKEMMGFQDTDTPEVIQAEKDNDMRDYAGSYDKKSQNYRDVVKLLHAELGKVEAAKMAELDAVTKLTRRNQGLEQAKEKQIQAAAGRADAAVADLNKQRAANNASRDQLQQSNQSLLGKVAETQRDADEKLAAAQEALDEANRRLGIKSQILVTTVKKLDDMLKPSFEVADGKVQYVSQREDTVWINLGQADGLDRQTTFAVYGSETSDVTDADSKASIEVTLLHGPHLAEARIVRDTIANPIMPGDLIHTPVWAPGQRQRFALNWGIDIDDDSKSDLQLVRNVITMNGGVVDFWLTDDGQPNGKMSTNTRYLITGRKPGVNHDPEVIRAFSDVNTRATELGIRSMPVVELLARMGWKSQSPVVRYGSGAKASDFRAKPPEGVPRTSSGNVSPLYQFKDRRPPNGGKSAY